MLRELHQAQPLGNSVRGDSMPFCKLFSRQIVQDQFIVHLNCVHQRVTESLFERYDRKVRTPEPKDIRRFFDGSTVVTFGVPQFTLLEPLSDQYHRFGVSFNQGFGTVVSPLFHLRKPALSRRGGRGCPLWMTPLRGRSKHSHDDLFQRPARCFPKRP